MKKITSLLLVAVLTVALSLTFPLNVFADGLDGDGTQSNPYLIRSEADYGEFILNAEDEACSGIYFKLEKDIKVTYTQDTDIANYPIGSESTPFEGYFDGNGKTIEFTADDFEGMFGYINNAKITNLTVVGNISIEDTYSLGGIVGYAAGATEISNCTFKGSIRNESSASDYTAGICGYGEGVLTIDNCRNYANINGEGTYLAGIVGYFEGASLTVKNCVNYGNITGSGYISGIIGLVSNSGFEVDHAINVGNISASGDAAGILNFKNTTSTAAQIVKNAINRGQITSTEVSSHSGGIAGLSDSLASDFSILNCANCGLISGGGRSGGILSYWSTRKGYHLILKNIMSCGETKGSNAGAVIGYYDSTKEDVMTAVYYDSTKLKLSAKESAVGAVALSDGSVDTMANRLNEYITNNTAETASWLKWVTGHITTDGVSLDKAIDGTKAQVAFENDLVSYELYAAASVLSEGSLWIIIAVVVVAIGTVATLIVLKKKKIVGVNKNEG